MSITTSPLTSRDWQSFESFEGEFFQYHYFKDYAPYLVFEGRISKRFISAAFRFEGRTAYQMNLPSRWVDEPCRKWMQAGFLQRFEALCAKYEWDATDALGIVDNERALFKGGREQEYQDSEEGQRQKARAKEEAWRRRYEERRQHEEERRRYEEERQRFAQEQRKQLEAEEMRKNGYATRRFPLPRDEVLVVPAFQVDYTNYCHHGDSDGGIEFFYDPCAIALAVRTARNRLTHD